MDLEKYLFLITNKLFQKTGYRLAKIAQFEQWPPDIEPAFIALYNQVGPHTMVNVERTYALYQAIEYIHSNKIAGDLVECGVWKGGSMMLAALTLKKIGDTSRHIYLYDAFKGLPPPTEKDIFVRSGQPIMDVWEKTKMEGVNLWCYATKEECERNMRAIGYPMEKIHIVDGWVEDTIPQNTPRQIALLRLDLDFYKATKHVLPHLFPRISRGGIFLSDNYGHFKGEQDAIDEYLKERRGSNIFLSRIDGQGRIAVVP